MKSFFRVAPVVLCFACFAAPMLVGQATESSINKQLDKYAGMSDPAQRPPALTKMANDVASMKPGATKLALADSLVRLATKGDLGKDAVQAVADALAKAIAEDPAPPKGPTGAYYDLAKLGRYEHAKVDLTNPLLTQADASLAASDAELAKVDFTLKDFKGKTVNWADYKGKIVYVYFFSTTVPACASELHTLDNIQKHFDAQGFVVLDITGDPVLKAAQMISALNVQSPILLDSNGKVAKMFHADGVPRSYVFGRDGKLVSEAIDSRSLRQVVGMLNGTGLHN